MQCNGLVGGHCESLTCLDGNKQQQSIGNKSSFKGNHDEINRSGIKVSIESTVFIWMLALLAVISFLNLASALWVIKVLQLNSVSSYTRYLCICKCVCVFYMFMSHHFYTNNKFTLNFGLV